MRALLAVLLLAAACRREAPPPQSPPVPKAEEGPLEVPPAYGGHTGSPLALPDGRRWYAGHYGFWLRVPEGVDAAEGVTAPESDLETLLLHPRAAELGVLERAVRDPKGYFGEGGILVTVRKRGVRSNGQDSLERVRADHAPGGLEPAESVQDVPGLALPALRALHAGGPEEYFLMGRHVVYAVVGRPGDPRLLETARGLREVSPTETPGGFYRHQLRDDGGVVYRDAQSGALLSVPPGYRRADPALDRGVHYVHAFRHAGEGFEVRTHAAQAGLPLGVWMETVAANVSASPQGLLRPKVTALPRRVAEQVYGAEEAFRSELFDVPSGARFAAPYRLAALVGFRRGTQAWVHIFLASDLETFERHMKRPEVGAPLAFGPS